MKIDVKINSVKNAALFVATCDEYSQYDIDYCIGKYVVDARSILGVISIGFDHICQVEFHCEDENTCEKFRKDMDLWIVKRED